MNVPEHVTFAEPKDKETEKAEEGVDKDKEDEDDEVSLLFE